MLNDIKNNLIDRANRPAKDSKKWRMTILGLQMIGGVVLVGYLIMLLCPGVAGNAVTLAQVAITAIGGIVAVYSGAQASVDWKNTAALENIHKVDEERRTEEVTFHIDPRFMTPDLTARYENR